MAKTALTDLQTEITDSAAQITLGSLPRVCGDPILLSQVFRTLPASARKYCQAKPLLNVSAEARGHTWQITVQDNGMGMDPDKVHPIFEAFRRLVSEEAYTGSGLGLAICRRIVEDHAGKIWAVSQEGQGSTFYFTLPKTPAEPIE